jgi:predicted DNA-binding antitoxin AbrB/MazE fold protein
MTDTVTAVFEHGVFQPESPCDLPEGTRVVLAISPASAAAPFQQPSAEERSRILREVVQRMMGNPIPPHSPRFTRAEMHDRGSNR